MRNVAFSVACTALVVSPLLAARPATTEPKFTKAPTVSLLREPVRVQVDFAVSEPTDVEVAFIDPAGNVVRHLVAGVVGRKDAVPPLKPESLEQSVIWDLRDDLGRPAVQAGLKARVRIGMRVAFGSIVGWNPYGGVGTPRALATDERGNVYLMTQSYLTGEGGKAGPKYIKVFASDGKYLRTVMPYSGRLKPERVAGFGLIDTDGPLTPRNHEGVWPRIYPNSDAILLPTALEDGRLVLRNDERIFFLDADGGASDGHKGVPLWATGKPRGVIGPLFTAFSPDARRLYIAGPYVDPRGTDAKVKEAWPKGRIYLLDIAKGGGAEPFATIPIDRDQNLEVPMAMRNVARAPHGPVHGLAVDKAGNVYACDRANDRIAIFDPAGKLIGEIPVRQPHLVAVHPGSGEVCVVTMRPVGRDQFDTRLLFFADAKATKPAAEMQLPESCGSPIMALDSSRDTAAVWLTGVSGPEVWRVERRGANLEVAAKLPLSSDGALWGADRIAVDPDTDDVYVHDGWSSLFRYNGLTGEGGIIGDGRLLFGQWERDTNQRANLTATDAAVGPDGFLYLRGGPRYSGPITRWDRTLRPMPFAATHTHVFTPYIYSRYGAGVGERGFDIHPDGRVFVLSMYHWNSYFVHVFTPEGEPIAGDRLESQVKSYGEFITSGLIGPLPAACGGLKVDAAGNVYVGMRLFPDGFRPPQGFEKDPAYGRLAGSVFKFRPGGGGIVSGRGKPNDAGVQAGGTFVDGALKAYPDFAVFSGGHGSFCVCRSPRFDLDPFGRLYIPNPLRYSVAVVDNAGNEILRFGQYGNADDPGAGKVIPLGWPLGVGVSKKHIYVSDMLNKRVVRADVAYAATADAAIPALPNRPFPSARMEDLVDALTQPDADAAAHALAELRKAGPAAMPALEAAFEKDGASRAMLRNAAAHIRADEVMKEIPRFRSALEIPPFRQSVHAALTRQSALPTLDDARVAVCHGSRVVKVIPAAQLAALVEQHAASESPRVRMAALWAAHRPDDAASNDLAVRTAKALLADKDERVRTLAAAVLFERGDAACFAPLLAGCLSKDQWVLDMARPLAKEVIILDGGPRALRFPAGPKEVELAIQLLEHPHNISRWVGAGILMLSGDERARAALAGRLGSEEIAFVRRRLLNAAEFLRLREATTALLADVGAGPGDRRTGTGWTSAEVLADIGDPDAVAPLIELLEVGKARDLALFALSRMFDGAVTTASEYRLIPDAQARLARVSIHGLPAPEEIRKTWSAFWNANKSKYGWDARQNPFRGVMDLIENR